MNLSGRTKVCTSLGFPIAQSLSPAVQTAAFRAVGLDWIYIAWGVKPERLAITVQALYAWEGHMGGNVTAPYKATIIPFLDDLTPMAARLQAVNVILRPGGRMVGDNTDGAGFIDSLHENGIILTGKRVTILGAGGAAKAVAFALQDAGVAEIRVVNRTRSRADALAVNLKSAGKPEVSAHTYSEGPASFIEGSDLIVNATSVGLQPDAPPLFDYSSLRPPLVVLDLAFLPRTTTFLRCAQENGCQTVNGVGMLLHQAALSFQGWTGTPAPLALMRQTLEDALRRREQEA